MDRPLPANLRRRAAELNLSHAEVARRAELNDRRYSHYVSGIREPDMETLLKIAKTLATTPDDLLGVKHTGGKEPPSEQDKLIDRIISAARVLEPRDLESVALQVEALANRPDLDYGAKL